ncbi:MAG: hypothetical protein ACR2IH_09810 [Pyrinomonadaceae bacterium]
MKSLRHSFPTLLVIFLCFGIQSAHAQKDPLSVNYTVSLSDPATQQFHVTTDIANIIRRVST